jgi:hypothetical protein
VSRLVGVLERRDLDGGIWVLRAPDADYTLYGDVPRELAGARVEVEGELDEGFGIGMAGPSVLVRSVRKY